MYRACQWTLHVGLSRAHYQGIAASEICAVMFAHRIPRPRWVDTMRRVRIMAAAARDVLNAA